MNLTLDPHGNIALDAYFPEIRRRTLQVSPEGGFFDHKDFLSAARRSRPGDCILIPTGTFPTADFHKSLEVAALQGSQAALIPENGVLTLSSEALFFRGITFGTETDPPLKIKVTHGLVVFIDCLIYGELEVEGATTEIALTRCAISRAKTGLHLLKGASAILHSTAISDCQTGLRADDGSNVDIRFSRFENCQSATAENPGSGVRVSQGKVKISGSRFLGNDIALALRFPRQTEISNSSFCGQTITSAFIEGDSSTGKVLIQNCKFQDQPSADQAQITATQAELEIQNCELSDSPASAIHTEGGCLKITTSRVKAEVAPGILANQTTLSVDQTHLDSATVSVEMQESTAQFTDCFLQGEIQQNGQAVDWQTSPHFSNCRPLAEWKLIHSDQEPLNFFLTKLTALAGLSTIKPQVEQLLRELQGQRLCQEARQPVTLAPYRLFMAGDPGTGRSTVTQLLTEAFAQYGILKQGHTVQCSFHDLFSYDEQGLRLLAESVRGGVLLIRRTGQPPAFLPEQQRRLIPDRRLKLKRLHDLIGNHGVIIVHGDRTLLRQLASADEDLRQIFRLFYDFPTYSAAELTSIVLFLCTTHQIEVSDECALKLNIGFHVTRDRKDRRYQNAEGAKELFQACQTRYLDRVSRLGRIDHQLLPEDISFPYDRAIAEILTTSPSFLLKCPHCEAQNPWQVALPTRLICSGCGKFFHSETGAWLGRNSLPTADEDTSQPDPRQRFTHRRIADIT